MSADARLDIDVAIQRLLAQDRYELPYAKAARAGLEALVAENETLRAALEAVKAAQSIGTARVIAAAALAAACGGAAT